MTFDKDSKSDGANIDLIKRWFRIRANASFLKP